MQSSLTTYTDPATQTIISDIIFWQETIWMTQDQMGKLYGKANSTLSEHIKNIYTDWELKEDSTSQSASKFGNTENTSTTIENSFKKPKKYYNLQVIIAVWFKVNSPQATSFRIRANKVIQQYIQQGYVLDDERLKWWTTFWWKRDYEQLMERVRAIRFDERNIYEKIKDLFTTAVDYEKSTIQAIEFFQTIQNKFHYAIIGMTSPEMLMQRVDSNKPALWMIHHTKNNITISEATVGKNYLLESELRKLYLLSEQFFSFAELQYAYERDLTMQDRVTYLDDLLKMNKLDILMDKWTTSREKADEYVKFKMAEYQQKRWSLEAYIEWAEYLLHKQ